MARQPVTSGSAEDDYDVTSSTDNSCSCTSTDLSELCDARSDKAASPNARCEMLAVLRNEQSRVINLEAMLLREIGECECPRRLATLMEFFERVDNVVVSLKTKIQSHNCPLSKEPSPGSS